MPKAKKNTTRDRLTAAEQERIAPLKERSVRITRKQQIDLAKKGINVFALVTSVNGKPVARRPLLGPGFIAVDVKDGFNVLRNGATRVFSSQKAAEQVARFHDRIAKQSGRPNVRTAVFKIEQVS